MAKKKRGTSAFHKWRISPQELTWWRGRFDRSAMSFIEAYAPQHFFVVNSQEHHDTKVGKVHVRYLRPHQIAKATVAAREACQYPFGYLDDPRNTIATRSG